MHEFRVRVRDVVNHKQRENLDIFFHRKRLQHIFRRSSIVVAATTIAARRNHNKKASGVCGFLYYRESNVKNVVKGGLSYRRIINRQVFYVGRKGLDDVCKIRHANDEELITRILSLE